MSPPVSVILGPGPYGDRMVEALLEARLLYQVVRYFPHFRLERADPVRGRLETERDLRLHGVLVRGLWSLWRRLPHLGRRETPRGPLFALVDHLARAHLGPARLLIGWSQVSLRCLHAARSAGAHTLLEHPTAHVDAWMELARAECARHRVGTAYSLLPRWLVRRMRAECTVAQAVCVPSSYARSTLLAAGVPAARIHVVPLGVDADRFVPAPPSPVRRPFRVLYVGRLELLKGLPYLLRAFIRLEIPDAELWLVGRPLPEMLPWLDRLPPRLPIRLLGPLPQEALPAVYRKVDVLVLPTLCDSFGLVLLEAMAAGLPVITTPHSAGPDLITEGVEGHITPIRDDEALRQRLRELARDPERRQAMGRRGRCCVLGGYTWAHYAARVQDLAARLLSPMGDSAALKARKGRSSP